MAVSLTREQKITIAILGLLQFTVILDFMIMSPLGVLIMPALSMTPGQFGVTVSAYAFSAGAAGLLAAGFADRYDRKSLLLFFYTGFLIGTALCGIANSYWFLLLARVVAGLFGGVLGSIVLAIVTDLFELDVRGRAMGILQTAFASSQILGLPAGIYFSNLWGWKAPFLLIAGLGVALGVVIWKFIQPVNAHLTKRTDRHPLHHLLTTVANPRYRFAFLATALLSLGGFMIMPFSSAFTTHNLGIDVAHLPMIYLASGLFTILIAPTVGKAADSYGNYPVFVVGSVLSLITVPWYTHMQISPLWLVITVTLVMFAGVFSRIIPAQTLMSAIPSTDHRGAFMAVSSSLQQIAGGLGAVASGLIVTQAEDKTLIGFDRVGYVIMGATVISIVMMYFISRMVGSQFGRRRSSRAA